MIRDSADFQRHSVQSANDAAEIGMNAIPHIRRDQRRTIFRAEHEMVMKAHVRRWHRAADPYGFTHPAKFICPFSILIMATGLMGLRSGPMVMVPATPS